MVTLSTSDLGDEGLGILTMTFKFYDIEDIEQILSLYGIVWPERKIGSKFWIWKFEDVPFAKSIIALAEEKGEVIGQEAIIPTPIKIDNYRYLAGQSVDSMVHPEYRGKGVFNKLVGKTIAEGRKKGYKLFYGFPNKNSLKTYQKNGWVEKARLVRYVKVIDWAKVIRSRRLINFFFWLSPFIHLINSFNFSKVKTRPEIKVVNEKYLPPFYESIWSEYLSKQEDLIAIDRNYSYLSWRYEVKPESEYLYYTFTLYDEPLGFAIIKKDDRGKIIRYKVGEFVTLRDDLLPNLVDLLEQVVKENEGATLEFQIMKDSALEGFLKDYGYYKRPDELPLLVVYFDELIGHKKWYITAGDYDIF